MNKVELIASLAIKTGVTKKDAEATLVAFQDIVKDELLSGGKVQLVGFGTFEVAERAEKKGRNPKTGEALVIPASRVPKFKPGKTFKDLFKFE